MNKMNVMITGCAGFIGSHAVDLFLENEFRVIGIDCFTYAGTSSNISHQSSNPKFRLYNCNIRNTSKILKLCKAQDIKWIINFAAETHVDNSIEDSIKFIHSNVDGVRSLLEVCRESKIKFLHVSTDEVYGSIMDGEYSENDMLNPRNPYAATKAAAEHLVTSYCNTYGIEYLIVRPSNNFGPRQHNEKFIPTILRSLLTGKKIPVYGNGDNVRDWLFVKDNVRMIMNILLSSPLNQIYNITNGNEKTNLQIIEKICHELDLELNAHINFVPDRLGHDFRYAISSKKIKHMKVYHSSNFKDNLKETILWYQKRISGD